MDMLFNMLANGLIFVAVPAVALFIGFYGAKSPWRRTMIGRSLMYMAVAMLMLLSLSLAGNWLDPYTGEQFIRFMVYALIAVVHWRLFLALRYAQTGKINAENPNYEPFKTWLRKKKAERASKKLDI